MATYVKAYAFFISIIVLIGLCVAAGILYGENQRTSDLFKTLMSDFEIKMVNITTNNSVLMSTLTTNFQTQMATMNTQIETLATAKGNLESQVASYSTTLTALQTNYDALLLRQTNISTALNNTWTLFTKALNKGQLMLEKSNSSIAIGKGNFTTAYNYFLTADYANAKVKSNQSISNYGATRVLFNTTNTYFVSAANKVSEAWTTAFVTKYININPQTLNMTHEMIYTNYYLNNASHLYTLGNTTGGSAKMVEMRHHWALYNTSYASYNTMLSDIKSFINAL